MKTFYCAGCGNLVFFENTQCVKCNKLLGFAPESQELLTLEPNGSQWRALGSERAQENYRQCANTIRHSVCNWMVRADDSNELCESCRINSVIPDLTLSGNVQRWYKLEQAKRRVLYSLKHLNIPIGPREGEQRPTLRFSFVADPPSGPKVMTGHANGLITINIAEADDAVREQRRVELKEAYRTLLGHLRHEIAHYYWDLLIADSSFLGRFNELFGEYKLDYATALQAYYRNGPPADWNQRFVSAYASAHPWEDWAETFAHYLHIEDMIETGTSFGISLKPKHPAARAMTTDLKVMETRGQNFDDLLHAWFPLTYALNEFNRGMGLPDVYPFVLADPAIEKLRFVHHVVHAVRA